MTKRVMLLLSAIVLAALACTLKESTSPSAPAAPEPGKAATAEPVSASPPTHSSSPAEASRSNPAEERGALTRVAANSEVCMVNNTYMGTPQIPVSVEGRTYYGCCDMCKGKLERDPSSRVATDPISGRSVDKAGAVIGRDARNRVVYFENEGTYRKYAGG
jgi:YHS domain-containing protein